ncbi:hypothetical protein OX90_11460 [Pseudomonas coronafaciens pv. porri]|uniref:Uncharacterized protein n=2 Tax=Pseudomonas TaxID=286 RepID=A0ABR5JPV8_9PSED|nr:hypothetical protein OX88_26305 [Pseudomonas coronafaciens pv. porri]KOP59428.1 hypothetical protein OX90_11460 [Pseudomonas coronafaciens pv. porri]
MIRVLLSLDLKKSEDQRTAFYAFLQEKGWKKTHDVDTVWTLEYEDANPDDETYQRIKNHIRSTLIEVSGELNLNRIEYVAQIGNAEYIAKAIKKEDGRYQQFNRALYED